MNFKKIFTVAMCLAPVFLVSSLALDCPESVKTVSFAFTLFAGIFALFMLSKNALIAVELNSFDHCQCGHCEYNRIEGIACSHKSDDFKCDMHHMF